jgi:hypothetical protein
MIARSNSFVIIGAMKCGTTSLYSYLRDHPEVVMCREKEPNFFLEKERMSLDEYKGLFGSKGKAYGEASTGYTKYPKMKADVNKMNTLIPNARLIYLVRDPIERIISHFIDNASRGVERKTLEDVLGIDFDENHYVQCSMYYTQVKRYLDFYSEDQILVLSTKQLKENRQTALSKVFRFIGVNPDYYSPDFEHEQHKTANKTVSIPIARRLAGTAPVKWAKRILPSTIVEPMRQMVKRPATRPDIESPLRHRLITYLQNDVDQLRSLTGQSFSHWQV